MDFTTVDKAKLFLGKSILTTEETALVEMLIVTVSGVIKSYCGWEVLAKDYVRLMDGQGGTSLDVGSYPLNTVTALVVADVDELANVSIDSERGEAYFDADTGSVFGTATRSIQISYNAGYATVPPELEYAAGWLLSQNYNRIQQKNIGVKKEQFTEVSVEYDDTSMPMFITNVLDRFKSIKVY